MSNSELKLSKYYWIRLYRDDAQWRPAQHMHSDNSTTTDYCWFIVGEEDEYYDTEVNEVGPEIVPPPQ